MSPADQIKQFLQQFGKLNGAPIGGSGISH